VRCKTGNSSPAEAATLSGAVPATKVYMLLRIEEYVHLKKFF
jgi:hypothetical protein